MYLKMPETSQAKCYEGIQGELTWILGINARKKMKRILQKTYGKVVRIKMVENLVCCKPQGSETSFNGTNF